MVGSSYHSLFTTHYLPSEDGRGRLVLDQDFSVDEVDDTGAPERVQADGDAFAGGADDRGDLAVRERQVDEHAPGLAAAVALGEVREEFVEARRDGVEGEVRDAALGPR